MFALSEYVIDQEIHENKRIRVFRGRNAQDGSPVVIKALKEEASGPSELYRLIYEYEISRNLEAEGVIKPLWLEQEGMFFALIMEDIGAVSLREYMQNRSVSPEDFLDIAIQLAQTLGDIHQQGILHRERPEDDPGSDRRGKERRAFQSGGPLCGQNPGNRDVKRQRTGERLGGGKPMLPSPVQNPSPAFPYCSVKSPQAYCTWKTACWRAYLRRKDWSC